MTDPFCSCDYGFTCTLHWGAESYIGHMRAVRAEVAVDTSGCGNGMASTAPQAEPVEDPKSVVVPTHRDPPNLSLLEREIANLRADRALMTNDAIDDRLAQIHARVKAELR